MCYIEYLEFPGKTKTILQIFWISRFPEVSNFQNNIECFGSHCCTLPGLLSLYDCINDTDALYSYYEYDFSTFVLALHPYLQIRSGLHCFIMRKVTICLCQKLPFNPSFPITYNFVHNLLVTVCQRHGSLCSRILDSRVSNRVQKRCKMRYI